MPTRSEITIEDVRSQLSPDVFAYLFPGYRYESEEAAISFRVASDDESSKHKESKVRFSVVPRRTSSKQKCYDIEEDKTRRRHGTFKCIGSRIDDLFNEEEDNASSDYMFSRRMDARIEEEPAVEDLPLSDRTEAILGEIKGIMDRYGLSVAELERIMSYSAQPSRLVITVNNRIYLSDYDNAEVKMDDLSKAVFFLYLKHPDGIRYKDLIDYRSELESIYLSITGRNNLDNIRESIDALVSPITSNSINEKVSKIKRAFKEVIDDRIAKSYYIDGKRGETKRITLDRNLVSWGHWPD